MISSPTPSHPKGPNAADLFKNAFVLYDRLTDEEKKLLAKPPKEIDPQVADVLFKKLQSIMDLLRQAKDAAYCDWAMGPQSFSSPSPQLNLVFKLGSVARWSAGYQFLSSNPEGAISDLSTQLPLAGSVATLNLIGFVVDTALTQTAINLIRDNAASLTPEATTQAVQMLANSALAEPFVQAMNGEANMLTSLADQLSNPETHDQTIRLMKGMDESGSRVKILDGDPIFNGDTKSMVSQLTWCAQVDRDFGAKAQLSDADFNAWWAQVNQQAADQPLAAEMLPSLLSIRNRSQLACINNSMLVTGLAILQNGSEQASLTDPITGQSFTYVQTPTGFELRSTFQSKGKPVTMSFSW